MQLLDASEGLGDTFQVSKLCFGKMHT